MGGDECRGILHIYKEKFGLPSIDPKCLQLLFYMQLNPGHNIQIKTSGFSTTPNLPLLEYKGKVYSSQETIFQKLTDIIGSDCDSSLSNQEKSRIMAYKRLNVSVLENPYILNLWGLEENALSMVKVYAQEKYFPCSVIFARRLNSYGQSLVQDLCAISTVHELINYAETDIENYFNNLQLLVMDSNYLMGNKPCSLDAHVCGYLAPLLILKFPNPGLQNIFKKYDRLCKYVRQFVENYGDKNTADTYREEKVKELDGDAASLGLVLCAGFISIVTMIGYGVLNDIIKFR